MSNDIEHPAFGKFCAATERLEEPLFGIVTELTAVAMREAGEDPANANLLSLRRVQFVHGLNSRAQRDWERECKAPEPAYQVIKRVVPPDGYEGEDVATYFIGKGLDLHGTVVCYRTGKFEFAWADGTVTGWKGDWLRAVALWRKENKELWP